MYLIIIHVYLHDFEEEKCARKKKGIYLMIYVNVFVSSCADIQHSSFHERAGFVQNGTICCWYAIFLIFVFDGNCKALWVT